MGDLRRAAPRGQGVDGPDERTLRQQVRAGLAWSTVNNLTLRAGSMAVGIVLARLLLPDQFGIYAVALAVQAVLLPLADPGLSADLIRSDDPEGRGPTVGLLGLVSGLLLAGVMVATAAPLADLLGSPRSAPVIAALSVTIALAGAGVVPWALLQRRFDQHRIFAIAAVDFVVATGVTIGLVLAGRGVMSLAIGRIVAQTVTLILQFCFAHVRPRYHVDRAVIGSALRFGAPVAGANTLSWALLNIDNVVIARTVGPVALGYYVLAFNISSWPMTAIGQVVRSVSLPTFARLATTGRDATLSIGLGATWAFALPVGVLLSLLDRPVIAILYGARWHPAAAVLAGLALFGAVRVLFDLMGSYLLARGAARATLLVQAWWFLALLPALLIGTRRWGIVGAGWTHVAVSVGLILPAYLVALHRAGADLRAVAARSWQPVAAMAAMVPVVMAARYLPDSWAEVLVGGGLGTLVCGLALGPWLRRLLRPAGSSIEEPLAVLGAP